MVPQPVKHHLGVQNVRQMQIVTQGGQHFIVIQDIINLGHHVQNVQIRQQDRGMEATGPSAAASRSAAMRHYPLVPVVVPPVLVNVI